MYKKGLRRHSIENQSKMAYPKLNHQKEESKQRKSSRIQAYKPEQIILISQKQLRNQYNKK